MSFSRSSRRSSSASGPPPPRHGHASHARQASRRRPLRHPLQDRQADRAFPLRNHHLARSAPPPLARRCAQARQFGTGGPFSNDSTSKAFVAGRRRLDLVARWLCVSLSPVLHSLLPRRLADPSYLNRYRRRSRSDARHQALTVLQLAAPVRARALPSRRRPCTSTSSCRALSLRSPSSTAC